MASLPKGLTNSLLQLLLRQSFQKESITFAPRLLDYGSLARQMFPIQQLPPGANVIYDIKRKYFICA